MWICEGDISAANQGVSSLSKDRVWLIKAEFETEILEHHKQLHTK